MGHNTRCRELLDAEGVAVLFIDTEHNELCFPCVSEHDPKIARRLTGLRFPADRGIAGAVLRSGHAEKVADLNGDTGTRPRFFMRAPRRARSTKSHRNSRLAPCRALSRKCWRVRAFPRWYERPSYFNGSLSAQPARFTHRRKLKLEDIGTLGVGAYIEQLGVQA